MRQQDAKCLSSAHPENTGVHRLYVLLFTLPNLLATFGEVTQVILKDACTSDMTAHLKRDTCSHEPSIKYFERGSRGDETAYSTVIRDLVKDLTASVHCSLHHSKLT